MERIDDAVSWYQQKIGAYDKQRWETSVEEKVLKDIENAPKKTAKVKSELIDVDLVRGSTFSKAKPQHGWLALAWKGISRVIFLPIYIRWWKKQTNGTFAAFLLVLYALQLGTSVLYMTDTGEGIKVENLSVVHIASPVVVMIFLGILHAQIIATSLSNRKINRRERRKASSKIPKHRRKKASSRFRASSTEQGSQSFDSKSSYKEEGYNTGGQAEVHFCADGQARQGQRVGLKPRRRQKASHADSSGVEVDESSKSHDMETTTESPKSSQDEQEESDGLDSLPFQGQDTALAANVRGNKARLNGPSTSQPRQLCDLGGFVRDSHNEQRVLEGLDIQNIPESSHTTTCSTVPLTSSVSADNVHSPKPPLSLDLSTSHTNVNGSTEPAESQSLTDATHNIGALSTETLRANSVDDLQHRHDRETLASQISTTLSQRSVNVKSSRSVSGCHRKISSRQSKGKQAAKESTGLSSAESDGENSPDSPKKTQMSEMEWEDTMHTECTTSSGTSDSDGGACTSATSMSDAEDQDNPFSSVPCANIPSAVHHLATGSDKVSCMIWEASEVKKVDLSVLDVGWTIIKKVDQIPERCDYLVLGVLLSSLMALVPLLYRAYHVQSSLQLLSLPGLLQALPILCGHDWKVFVVIINGVIQRLCLGLVFFFLLSVAERTFKQRLQYAKHFCYLTSSRRAKKYELPHFRLNKVRNIKTWLSLRSYLKKRGPQRSVDTIVSAAFLTAILLISLMSVELLRDSGAFLDFLGNWELCTWCLALCIYLLRFMTLGTKINKKYRNFSVLITEQINLYLHMEKKPHKKEELMLANSVLKLAEALLKELESPFKISGLSANPFLYNITKVVILSAFSGVLTELLGFKLKLYKIKLRA